MRREIPSVAAMAALLVGSQIAAIALSPIFAGAGFQAFQRPEDVTNTVIYLIMILAFTAVILGLVRYKRQNLAKYVIMASIFITLAFILLLPLFYALDYATGGTADGVLLGNVATVLAFTLAAGLVYLLVNVLGRRGSIVPRRPAERDHRVWHRPREPRGFHGLDALCPEGEPAGGSPPPERRRTPRLHHRQFARVRDGPHRLTRNGQIRPPLWLSSHGPMARTIPTKAHRRAVPSLPEETPAGDRPRATMGVHRTPTSQALSHKRREPQGPRVERGVRERAGSQNLRDEEGQNRHRQGESVEPELRDAEHHHPRRDDPDGSRPRTGHLPSWPRRRRERSPGRGARDLGPPTGSTS